MSRELKKKKATKIFRPQYVRVRLGVCDSVILAYVTLLLNQQLTINYPCNW
jgi:hypothetical protein